MFFQKISPSNACFLTNWHV